MSSRVCVFVTGLVNVMWLGRTCDSLLHGGNSPEVFSDCQLQHKTTATPFPSFTWVGHQVLHQSLRSELPTQTNQIFPEEVSWALKGHKSHRAHNCPSWLKGKQVSLTFLLAWALQRASAHLTAESPQKWPLWAPLPPSGSCPRAGEAKLQKMLSKG